MTTKLTLSPEALAVLRLPLASHLYYVSDSRNNPICKINAIGTRLDVNVEIAAFIAALVNAALTPAADAAPTEPDHGQVDLEQASAAGRAGVTS